MTKSKTEALHQRALDYDLEDGIEGLRRIIRDPACDRGTALLVFWRAKPHWWRRFRKREEVPAAERDHWDLLQEIIDRYRRGAFRSNRIPFDPQDTPWGNLTRTTVEDVREARRAIPWFMGRKNLVVEENKEETLRLMKAILDDDLEMARVAIEAGANVDGRPGSYPVHEAVRLGRPDILKLLLENGAITDPVGVRSPLWLAANDNDNDAVRALVDAGANVDATDSHYGAPLHIAARRGYPDVVKVLLEAGADPEIRVERKRPLDWALQEGHEEAASHLLEHGADVAGALHFAVLPEPPLVELVLRFGADLNTTTASGDTPLHWAAANSRRKAIELLLERGADPTAGHRRDRKTPLDLARDVRKRVTQDRDSRFLPTSDREKAAARVPLLDAIVELLEARLNPE